MPPASYPGASERDLFRMSVAPSSRTHGYAGGRFSAVELVLLATVLLVAAIGLI
jgi:hypothetical protein